MRPFPYPTPAPSSGAGFASGRVVPPFSYILYIEGSSSWVTFILNGQHADFHRPHPSKEALRYRVKDVREFLQRAGVTP